VKPGQEDGHGGEVRAEREADVLGQRILLGAYVGDAKWAWPQVRDAHRVRDLPGGDVEQIAEHGRHDEGRAYVGHPAALGQARPGYPFDESRGDVVTEGDRLEHVRAAALADFRGGEHRHHDLRVVRARTRPAERALHVVQVQVPEHRAVVEDGTAEPGPAVQPEQRGLAACVKPGQGSEHRPGRVTVESPVDAGQSVEQHAFGVMDDVGRQAVAAVVGGVCRDRFGDAHRFVPTFS
jgi:hypothetical protein